MHQQVLISVVNRVVGVVTRADQVLRIQQRFVEMLGQVFNQHGIHVVNINSPADLPSFHSEVASAITDNNLVPYHLPFC